MSSTPLHSGLLLCVRGAVSGCQRSRPLRAPSVLSALTETPLLAGVLRSAPPQGPCSAQGAGGGDGWCTADYGQIGESEVGNRQKGGWGECKGQLREGQVNQVKEVEMYL